MAAVGTAASIVGLVGTAIKLAQKIKKARATVRGSSKSLDNVSAQLDAISTSLRMVEAERQIQTVEVQTQVEQVIKVEEELQAFFDRLQAQQTRGTIHKYIHALKSGDEDDDELAQIVTRLGSARSDLHLRISVINVGLIGNLQDGFQVAWRTLEGTNQLLREGLGVTLALAERLSNRDLETLGGDTVILEMSDIEALGLGTPITTAAGTGATTEGAETDQHENLRWKNNTTGTKTRINVGNMGMEAEAAIPVADVAHSTFGDGLRVMVGSIGAESASSFNDNFWKD